MALSGTVKANYSGIKNQWHYERLRPEHPLKYDYMQEIRRLYNYILAYCEKRYMAVIAIYTLVCLVILGMNLLRIPWTYDGFWHLKMGEDFVTKGLPFWIDHFSFTYAGERIVGAPYIFQILIYFLTTISGVEEGFLLYKMICFGVVMGLFVCMAIRFRIPLLVFFATVPILVLLLQMRQIVRPELLSYVLSVIAMFFYLKARESFNVGNMVSICVLILFWVNYHTPVIGYIIFFGLFIDLAVDHFRNHNNSNIKSNNNFWFRWLGWGLILFLIGFANLDLNHFLIGSINFSSKWMGIISEYKSPLKLYDSDMVLYWLAFLAFLLFVWLLIQKEFGFALITLILLYSGSQVSRLITPGGIVVLCIAIYMFKVAPKHDNAVSRYPIILAPLLIVSTMLGIFTTINISLNVGNLNKQMGKRYPWDVVEYMQKNGMKGRVLNQLHIGGFLAYFMGDDIKIYIDGRTNILYPLEHVERYVNFVRNPSLISEEVMKYDIDYAIFSSRPTLLDTFTKGTEFKLDFMGEGFFLLKRGEGEFEEMSSLVIHPECWSGIFDEASLLEFDLVQEKFPEISPLYELVVILKEYRNQDKKEGFARRFVKRTNDDILNRFLSILAFKENDYEVIEYVFYHLEERKLLDYLLVSIAMLQIESVDKSEAFLNQALKGSFTASSNEILIAQSIVSEIAKIRPLEKIDKEVLEYLNSMIAEDSRKSVELSLESFCT